MNNRTPDSGEKRKRGRPRVDKTSPEYLARKKARELGEFTIKCFILNDPLTNEYNSCVTQDTCMKYFFLFLIKVVYSVHGNKQISLFHFHCSFLILNIKKEQ